MKEYESTEQIFTLPNLLSALRVPLIILFFFLFDSEATISHNLLAVFALALNALSDCVDGKLSRMLGQTSELGKVLDPVADYLTKVTLILCFLRKYYAFIGFLLLFLVRVFVVAWSGWKTLKQVGKNHGAIFAGKVDTVTFYTIMIVLVLFPNIPIMVAYIMVSISGVTMIAALVMYLRHFRRLRAQAVAAAETEKN